MEQIGTAEACLAAAWAQEARAGVLAGRLDLAGTLESQQIIAVMELPEVPRSTLLVKGILESQGRSIPLVDLRMALDASISGSTDAATALIVDVGGTEIGLIVARAPEA